MRQAVGGRNMQTGTTQFHRAAFGLFSASSSPIKYIRLLPAYFGLSQSASFFPRIQARHQCSKCDPIRCCRVPIVSGSCQFESTLMLIHAVTGCLQFVHFWLGSFDNAKTRTPIYFTFAMQLSRPISSLSPISNLSFINDGFTIEF